MMEAMPIQPVIPWNTIPFFASLESGNRAALEPLCRIRRYDKGEAIFVEGDKADRMYFLSEGRVKIVKSAGARDVILELLGPGEPVGAVAVYERRTFPASAIAVEPSTIVSISESEFFALLEARPAMVRQLLSALTMRLMLLNKRLADMSGSVETRAARLFLTLAERLGVTRDANRTFLPLPLSRQELADLIGTTLETTIRLMSRWQKDGVVLTEGDGFVVENLGALRETAER